MSFARLPRIFRTASFGLAILYAALFTASTVILGGIVYWTVLNSLERQMATRIGAEIDLLQEEFKSEGLQELVREIHERAAHFPALNYLVVDAAGKRLAGNLPAMPTGVGWSDIETEPDTGNYAIEQNFRVRSILLDGGVRLAVGDDLGPIEEIQQAFLNALGWGLLAFLLLSLAGGVLLSNAFLRRVDTIRQTAEAIIGGELHSRIPLRGTNDNFDRLSATLNRMLDQIQDLMESLRQVSNDIAHALRTPLSRLRQKLEIAKAHVGQSPKIENAVDGAIGEADTILDTFSALLRIAQIEAGTRHAGFRQVSLSTTFETIADAYSAAAEEQGKELSTKIEPDLWCWGDRDLLTEMLANLLDNAIRHTPAGTNIEMTLARRGAELVATLADGGPGIPEEEREQVFRRFYRLERNIAQPGNGLGLSLVAAVADLHEIELSLEDNAPGLRIRMAFEAIQSGQGEHYPVGNDSQSEPRPFFGGLESSAAAGAAGR
jgi:signal transduction histidine kinase